MADQLLTAAMEDRMTWKPISSAPRDGTDILIYDAGTGSYEVSSYWTDTPRYWDGNWGDGEYEHTPTHWMPLPEPPKETDDGR